MSDRALRIELSLPEHGWMYFTISNEDQSFCSDASDAFQDSLEEMVSAILKLAQGADGLVVTLFEEPCECDMLFRRDGNDVDLTITRYPDDCRVEEIGELEFRARRRHVDLCTAFWRAFRKLESKAGGWDLAGVWSYPFPTSTLRRLTEQIKMMGS